jgi:N-acetylneuraminic acid mutarotase
MLVFGGAGNGSSTLLNDLWIFRSHLGSWMHLVSLEPSAPEPRRNAAMVWDLNREHLLLFGGLGARGPLGDLWAYDRRANRWQQIEVTGPPPRAEAAAVWDVERSRLLIYGGSANSQALGDVWSFEPASQAWSQLAPEGAGPGARFRHAAVWDADRSRMIVFGGYGGGFPGSYLNDLWAYDASANAWESLPPAGAFPPSRARHSMAWDQAHQRILMFGGYSGGIDYLRDLWAYSVPANAWEQVGAPNPPTPRAGQVAALDPADALLLFGGGSGSTSNELWIYRD